MRAVKRFPSSRRSTQGFELHGLELLICELIEYIAQIISTSDEFSSEYGFTIRSYKHVKLVEETSKVHMMFGNHVCTTKVPYESNQVKNNK